MQVMKDMKQVRKMVFLRPSQLLRGSVNQQEMVAQHLCYWSVYGGSTTWKRTDMGQNSQPRLTNHPVLENNNA